MNGKQSKRIRKMIKKTGGTRQAYQAAKRGWYELPQTIKERYVRQVNAQTN